MNIPPRLCVTIAAPTMAELRARRDGVRDADLVELRLDSVRDPDVAGALNGRSRDVIVTCRPAWEGGEFSGSEEQRRSFLREALERGAEYVDVEWRAGFDDIVREFASRVVLSSHDYAGVPADLPERYRAMRAAGTAVVKLAVRADRLSHCLPLFEIGRRNAPGERAALVAMGDAGVPSRLLPAHFGSCWSYSGTDVAPGQIPPDRLLDEFRFREVSEHTAIYGIVGAPVGHSLSPAMHNAAFRAAGVDAVYVPLQAADADDFLQFARALSLRGASVTAPFKRVLASRLDETDAVSCQVGAINTIRVDAGRWLGTNTDVAGFLEPLKRRFPLVGAHAAVLGAGGAACAAVVALASEGAQVDVYGRDLERATEVARLGKGRAHTLPPDAGSWDLLVNATPVGTYPHGEESPLDPQALAAGDGARAPRLVYDLVYNPPRTRLMADAERAGCQTIGGFEMLVAQASRQFEWWTSTRVGAEIFRNAALRRLAAQLDLSPIVAH